MPDPASTPAPAPSRQDLTDQVILVTGATDGLGRAVAETLAGRDATVLVHGRDNQRGQTAIAEIQAATGNERLRSYRADLADLAQVHALAEQVTTEQPRLSVLLNNAGLGVDPIGHTSADGHELTFQVDYLAPYMLSYLLAPLLAATGTRHAPARIVNVSSAGQAPINFDDVMLTRSFDGVQAYCQAKLADVMLTFDLAEQLLDTVTANCLHPASMMPTKIVTHMFSPMSEVADGVASTVRAVTDPALNTITGRYFNQQREARANDQAYDPAARARLRQLAADLTGVPATIASTTSS